MLTKSLHLPFSSIIVAISFQHLSTWCLFTCSLTVLSQIALRSNTSDINWSTSIIVNTPKNYDWALLLTRVASVLSAGNKCSKHSCKLVGAGSSW